jgi:ribonuclease P protein component
MTAMDEGPHPLRRLTKRSQFLQAARGNRAGRSAFGLQVTPVRQPDAGVGFTVTKKIGNAPERNRIKRRLRAAAAACARDFQAGHDYVLVGRRDALAEPFDKLVADLGALIGRVHQPRSPSERPPAGRGPRKT